MTIELSAHERETRELLNDLPVTTENIMITGVFNAMWSSSLAVDKIERIACAMHGFSGCELKPALTKLVRAKVLRSRMISGVRHYEMNLSGGNISE